MEQPITILACVVAMLPAAQTLANATPIKGRKTDGCGRRLAWIEHLEESGFAPTRKAMLAGPLVRIAAARLALLHRDHDPQFREATPGVGLGGPMAVCRRHRHHYRTRLEAGRALYRWEGYQIALSITR